MLRLNCFHRQLYVLNAQRCSKFFTTMSYNEACLKFTAEIFRDAFVFFIQVPFTLFIFKSKKNVAIFWFFRVIASISLTKAYQYNIVGKTEVRLLAFAFDFSTWPTVLQLFPPPPLLQAKHYPRVYGGEPYNCCFRWCWAVLFLEVSAQVWLSS